MDKNSILQYKSLFDGITRHIESEDAKEQIEIQMRGCTKGFIL